VAAEGLMAGAPGHGTHEFGELVASPGGAFQRAMRLVPPEEAQALWADFDAQMERLYAVWVADCASPSKAASGQ
jgi:hypothetical protein